MIVNGIKHPKPLKAVAEPLNFDDWVLNYRSDTPNGVFFYVNLYAIILPLLTEFHNASLRLVDILWITYFIPLSGLMIQGILSILSILSIRVKNKK